MKFAGFVFLLMCQPVHFCVSSTTDFDLFPRQTGMDVFIVNAESTVYMHIYYLHEKNIKPCRTLAIKLLKTVGVCQPVYAVFMLITVFSWSPNRS